MFLTVSVCRNLFNLSTDFYLIEGNEIPPDGHKIAYDAMKKLLENEANEKDIHLYTPGMFNHASFGAVIAWKEFYTGNSVVEPGETNPRSVYLDNYEYDYDKMKFDVKIRYKTGFVKIKILENMNYTNIVP